MIRKYTILALIAVFMVSVVGCATDMDIRNDNAPDTKRVLTTSSDLASLLGGTFLDYWSSWEKSYPSMSHSVISDAISSSWGNWGMRDASEEPRKAWDNDPSYTYNNLAETPWYGTYRTLSSTNDVARALNGGLEFDETTDGISDNTAWAFIRFMQGLAHGSIGLMFDKGFIFDETVDLAAGTPPFASRNELIDAAKGYLQEAITLSSTSYTLPSTFINGLTPSNEDIQRWSYSLLARYEAQRGRTKAESDASNWSEVISNIDNGITVDMAPEGDDNIWWKRTIERVGYYTWTRADMKLIGHTDVSGNFDAWMALPAADRDAIEIFPTDRRITGSVDESDTDGLYFTHAGSSPFRSNRGTYHHSFYGWTRYLYHKNPAVGPMPFITTMEMDMLRAEALLQLKSAGYKTAVADLINKTRVTNGQLPPLDGTESDDELFEQMVYEKRLEDGLHHSGGTWFDQRRWMEKTQSYLGWPGNMRASYPVPGLELETLLFETYTFGGPGNPITKVGANVIDRDYIQNLRADLESRNRIDRESARVKH